MRKTGAVYLVGAGPGDPGLLTLRGSELLRTADTVVYDALVSPEVIDLIHPGAERIYAGKRSEQHSLPQGELNRLLVSKAKEGKRVVRLKGGDPCTFGRGGEEAAQLAASGIPFEIVPGVSSITGVPAYAGIPLTHRNCGSILTILTGHHDPDSSDCGVDWAEVARTPGTKVVLMGLKHIGRIAEKLQEHGMDPLTPAAIIRWGTTPRQEVLQTTLKSLPEDLKRHGLGAPALTVIGDVVRMREKLNWFEKRPLLGRRVVVTRASEQAADLVEGLRESGAWVLEIPAVRIAPPQDKRSLIEAVTSLGGYDWIVFTSVNGVRRFFDHFLTAYDDLRDLGGVRLAAVGPATADCLRGYHLKVDLVPKRFEAAAIGEALKSYESVENLRVLLPRAEVGVADLPRQLEEMGAIVDDIPFYRTEHLEDGAEQAAADLLKNGADWLTFASGSAAQSFHARFDLGSLKEQFPEMRIASIGPQTSRAIRDLGVEVDTEASVHTIEGLLETLESTEPRSGL